VIHAAWGVVLFLAGFILGAVGIGVVAWMFSDRMASKMASHFEFIRRALVALCVRNKISKEHCDGVDAMRTQELLVAGDFDNTPTMKARKDART